jgi:hypothetical protein
MFETTIPMEMNGDMELLILDQESHVQCIICLQHFEPCEGALCSGVKVRHFVCDADLDISLGGANGAEWKNPCPMCNTANHDTTRARHIQEDAFERYIGYTRELFKGNAEQHSSEQIERWAEDLQREVKGQTAFSISKKLLEHQSQTILDPPQRPSCGLDPVDPGDSCDDMLWHDDELCWRGMSNWAEVARDLAAGCAAHAYRHRGRAVG